ncbi:FbpB family small basic protein [Lentibacillus amyloliquefaciens]|nr:FbpB family small basic protein [Lentibacillus amyloliquefaciens]
MKRRLSFDELVQENRKEMLQDESVQERIEKNMEAKMHQSLNEKHSK